MNFKKIIKYIVIALLIVYGIGAYQNHVDNSTNDENAVSTVQPANSNQNTNASQTGFEIKNNIKTNFDTGMDEIANIL